MNFKKHILLAIIAVIAITSCKKDSSIPQANNVDVYLAGVVDYNKNNYNMLVAAYWKNGVVTMLDDSHSGGANAIAVNKSDIYVAGYTFSYNINTDSYAIGSNINSNSNPMIGTYWKNGVATTLGLGTVCTSIAVVGNDIYVAGYSYTPSPTNTTSGFGTQTINNPVGTYWKNGIATSLGTNTICTA